MASSRHHAPPMSYPGNSRHLSSLQRGFALLPSGIARASQRFLSTIGVSTAMISLPQQTGKRSTWTFSKLLSLPNALIILWVLLIWWGERLVFDSSIRSCQWSNWERWPPGSTPHHLVFLADPQLVDPHTYPGRPWPLSTFTVRYTDLYLLRSYSLLHQRLHPDTIIFLGDLFDGGREWHTNSNEAVEDRWKQYGEDFWLREYDRFGSIFFENFGLGGHAPGESQRGRKIVASLPGNHDLGLGMGIQLPVRDRFNAYFGDGSRVDVIANHTFVSVDTVSLSAKGQSDPSTASQGSGLGDGPAHRGERIWRPVQQFLDSVQATKRRATYRELSHQQGRLETPKHSHSVTELNESIAEPTIPDGPEFPTVLLTHVPLYRPPGTPCGPLRERWPPSPPPGGQTEPLDKDDRNAISVHAGYQYQNVLTPEISTELVEKVGNVAHVFSGDDHDYCEIVHKSYTTSAQSIGTGGIREITVKSMSWAMGVRKPGFLLLSLWNPIDNAGNPRGTRGGGHGAADGTPLGTTMESHLCLLPDQLSIFIRYAIMLGFTLLALLVRAIVVSLSTVSRSQHAKDAQEPLLPLARKQSPAEQGNSSHGSHSQGSSDSSQASSLMAPANPNGLAARTSVRARSPSPSIGYGIPSTQTTHEPPLVAYAGTKATATAMTAAPRQHHLVEQVSTAHRRPASPGLFARILSELGYSIGLVACVAVVWYYWLLRNG